MAGPVRVGATALSDPLSTKDAYLWGWKALGVLGLMIFIDCSDGLEWAFGTQVLKKACTVKGSPE